MSEGQARFWSTFLRGRFWDWNHLGGGVRGQRWAPSERLLLLSQHGRFFEGVFECWDATAEESGVPRGALGWFPSEHLL